MKGKKLLCIILSLAAVCSLMLIRDSAAWLDTKTGNSPKSTITVDKMVFSFDGDLGTYLQYMTGEHTGNPYLVTEQNLIVTNGGKITVTNYSTIPTEARFKITYQAMVRTDPNDASTLAKVTKTYTASSTDTLKVEVGGNWIQKNNDGYFYYFQPLAEGASQRVEGFPANNAAPDDAITEISYLDELIVGNTDILIHDDYLPADGDPFAGEVHVVFEAKQKDKVTWQQITTWATS